MKMLGKYAWRVLMTALVAVGLAGATAQLDLAKSHRMKELERQWTQVHSSDLESQLLAEQKRTQRRWFFVVAVGLFLAGNIVLAIGDVTAKKPEMPEPAESGTSDFFTISADVSQGLKPRESKRSKRHD